MAKAKPKEIEDETDDEALLREEEEARLAREAEEDADPDADADADADDGAGDEPTEEEKRLAAIETKARSQGWFPEDEWDEARAKRTGRKKPAIFLTAEDYLEQVDKSTPLLRSQLRRIEAENAELKQKQADTHGIFKYQQEQHKKMVEKIRKEAKQEAQRELDEAIDEGDKVKGKAAREKLEAIHTEERDEIIAETKVSTEADDDNAGADDDDKRKKPKLHPTLAAWIEKNPWFEKDGALNGYMIECYQKVKRDSPGMEMADQYDKAKRMVKAKFPEKFGINPRRQANGGHMEPSNDRGASRTTKTFESLPKEDRDMYDRQAAMFAERGEKYTKEEFVKEYHQA